MQLRGETVAEMQEIFARTTEIAVSASGLVEDHLSSFVLITFGVPRPDPDVAANQARAMASLMSALGPRIRLVHGRATALVGLWGGDVRLFYGSLIPDFERCLQALVGLEFGSAKRL